MSTAPEQQPLVEPVPLRRNRDFQVLWISQAISSTGQSISTIAYPLLILGLTGSAVRAGLVGTCVAIARYAGGIALAPMVDRTDRRTLLIACDSVRFMCAAAVTALVWAGAFRFVLILVLVSVAGFVSSPIGAAIDSAIVRVVPDPQLEAAMAQDMARGDAADVTGNGVAGLLYGISRGLPFAVQAVGYLASIIGAVSLRTSLKVEHPEDEEATGWLGSIAVGFRWLLDRRSLLAVWGCLGFINLSFAASTILIIVFAHRSGATSFETGIPIAMGSAVGITGAMLAPRLLRKFGPTAVSVAACWMFVLMIPLFAVAHGFLELGIAYSLMCFLVPPTNVVLASGIAREVPDHLRGRIWSFLGLLVSALGALGPVIAGSLADSMGRIAALPMAIPALITALAFTFIPALRNHAKTKEQVAE